MCRLAASHFRLSVLPLGVSCDILGNEVFCVLRLGWLTVQWLLRAALRQGDQFTLMTFRPEVCQERDVC